MRLTVSFSRIAGAPAIAAVSNVSIEWSRWTRLLDGELAWKYGSGGGKGSAYVEGGKGSSVLVEGFVVELDELLFKGVKKSLITRPGQGV